MKPLKHAFYPLAFAFCVLLAVVVSPLASSLPDGLESAAGQLGFMEKEKPALNLVAVAPGYSFPDVSNEGTAKSAAGAFGVIAALVAGAGAGYLMSSIKRR
jgi:hypothetical protein